MKKWILRILVVLFSIPVLFFLTIWLFPRPADTTPDWVFEGDGSELNYCELPVLDGSGLTSKDIPQAFTPGCGYTSYPQPILKGCTEPLVEGAQDLRGLWQSIDPQLPDHVERIEQCGDRIVVTAQGLIHDHSREMLSNDVSPMKIGPWWFCVRTSQATAEWHDNQLHQKLFGVPTVVMRYIDENGVYNWTHPAMGHIKMQRICKVPEHARAYTERHDAL